MNLNFVFRSISVRLVLACVLSQTNSNHAQSGRTPFEYPKEDFGVSRTQRIEKVDSTDESVKQGFPIDAPAHYCYNLEAKRTLPALEKGARYFFPAYSFVCIVPTFDPSERDFAKAYPNFSQAVVKIGRLLKGKPTSFRQFEDLFDFPYNNAGWTFRSKVAYLEHPTVSGVFFLTQYSNGMLPSPANNEELTATFQGLSKNGRYYIAAKFSTTHPSLPRGIDFVDKSIQDPPGDMTSEQIREYERRYLKKEGEKVDALRDEEFRPALPTIKKLISTISVSK